MSGDERQLFAFLRGINLGGRRIGNAELCAAFGRCGIEGAQAFRAAGNVAFRSAGEEAKLVERIEAGLASVLGYEVRTLLRDADELRAIAGFSPFPEAELEAAKGKLQVCLFAKRLDAAQQRAVLSKSTERDRLVAGEREIYWLPAGGVSESELDWDRLAPDGALQTMRTMGTVEGMVRKFVDP